MSTLQNTPRHRDRITSRLGVALLAVSALIAIGVALLILTSTGQRTIAATKASNAQPLSRAALAAEIPARAGRLRDPGSHVLAYYPDAPAPIATPAHTGSFRDPGTHKLLRVPVKHKRPRQRPHHPSSGGVAP